MDLNTRNYQVSVWSQIPYNEITYTGYTHTGNDYVRYEIQSTALSWSDAKTSCESTTGRTIARIKNQADQDAVATLLTGTAD